MIIKLLCLIPNSEIPARLFALARAFDLNKCFEPALTLADDNTPSDVKEFVISILPRLEMRKDHYFLVQNRQEGSAWIIQQIVFSGADLRRIEDRFAQFPHLVLFAPLENPDLNLHRFNDPNFIITQLNIPVKDETEALGIEEVRLDLI